VGNEVNNVVQNFGHEVDVPQDGELWEVEIHSVGILNKELEEVASNTADIVRRILKTVFDSCRTTAFAVGLAVAERRKEVDECMMLIACENKIHSSLDLSKTDCHHTLQKEKQDSVTLLACWKSLRLRTERSLATLLP
jgi:hypothetical protein